MSWLVYGEPVAQSNRHDTASYPTVISPTANYFLTTVALMPRTRRGDDLS
jgi:hypothetical protein